LFLHKIGWNQKFNYYSPENYILKMAKSGTGTSTLFNEEIMERFIVADEELHDTPCQTERYGDRNHQDR
jgi:hypothetical protein